MISPSFLWYRTQQEKEKENDLNPLTQWISALNSKSSINKKDSLKSIDENINKKDNLLIHIKHRRPLYLNFARQLSKFSDTHYYYRLMMWCYDQNIFIHPAVKMHRKPSSYRDHIFTVSQDIPRLTPLFAIPEKLILGFKDVEDLNKDDDNNLRDEEREKNFNDLNSGDQSDADICKFFFASLGMIVSDLVTAKSSPLTDSRWVFAELLGKIRTLQNAPYFEDDVVLDSESTGLADVLLQMIRNYINGGPLVGKLDRTELRWAVSVCLSHSTPLIIASTKSIGVIPIVHLFPHGGKETNSFIITRTSHPKSAERIAAYFKHHHGYNFNSSSSDNKWIYVVNAHSLREGDEISLQAMAPVCGRDLEADKMWRLSCGVVPEEYMTTSAVAQMQHQLTRELIEKGNTIINESFA